jgi:GNAT superfamily N-acetyltransferase
MEKARPEDRRKWWKFVRDGVIVGSASAGLDQYSATPGRALARIAVHPDHRTRGIGSALWDTAAAHLDEIRGTRLATQSRGDDASRRFCEKRGMRADSATEILAVDPVLLPPPPPPPAGVELRAWPTVDDDDLDELFHADHEAFQDEPGPFDTSAMTFEQWLNLTFRHPEFDTEVSTIAYVNGAPVGLSALYVDRDAGRARNGGTGVLPEYRGRGLATLMKRRSLTLAAEAGITSILTENDEANAAMLAINRKLGYAPFSVRQNWLLDL